MMRPRARGAIALALLAAALALAGCGRASSTEGAPMPRSGEAPARYVLIGARGARALPTPPSGPSAPAPMGGVELAAGFGYAVTDRRVTGAGTYLRLGRTGWVSASEVATAHPSAFTGAAIPLGRALDVAWVIVPVATVRATPDDAARAVVTRPFHTRVDLTGPCRSGWCPLAVGWVRAADLAVPARAPRPAGVGPVERWLDIDLDTQTLVAYQGDAPVLATLVSTGIGRGDSPFATPTGTFTIARKAALVRMDNLEHTGVVPYSYDVPLAQYFTPGKALHAALWHDAFGRPTSHGCVNLAPRDAEWLFAFTSAGAGAERRGTTLRIRGQRPPIAAR